MRRMVKEHLLTFDATPLFPERLAYTVPYKLSHAEARLYKAVTEYVREEFNRAEALQNDKRAGTVGFALTILQRRLASSPEAIYQSLRRRKERLERRLRELELLQRGAAIHAELSAGLPALDAEDVEDLEDAPDSEMEADRSADPRPGHRRAHHHRAQGGDCHTRPVGSPGTCRAPERRRPEMAGTGVPLV